MGQAFVSLVLVLFEFVKQSDDKMASLSIKMASVRPLIIYYWEEVVDFVYKVTKFEALKS